MSQSGRPTPLQPPFTNDPVRMAQTQRPPGLSSTNFVRRPEHGGTAGLQLPPIQSIPPGWSTYDNVNRPVQLPPIQVPRYGPESPSRSTATRSIPVAHLLSSNPPSPPKSLPIAPAPQTFQWRSTAGSYGDSPTEHRMQPLSYQQPPPHRLDQMPMSFRQQQPPPPSQAPGPAQYPVAQYALQQKPPLQTPHLRSEADEQRQYSPAISVFSSPSYTHSEPSPRSSIGPSSQQPPRPRVRQPPPFNFTLSIRQQPAAARACGFGERDRRVIDPPPILELKITNRTTGAPEADPNAMLALDCMLLSPEGHDDETELPPARPNMAATKRLMGTSVASPYQAKDEHGIAGTFFVFPDLSCRSPGRYRLRFKLIRVEPTNMTLGAASVASVVTDVFHVYTAKDFPGMRASSDLLKSLRRQGLNVGVKKGSEARKGKGKTKKPDGSAPSSDGDDSEGDDGASSGDMSPKTQARKKGKRRKQG